MNLKPKVRDYKMHGCGTPRQLTLCKLWLSPKAKVKTAQYLAAGHTPCKLWWNLNPKASDCRMLGSATKRQRDTAQALVRGLGFQG